MNADEAMKVFAAWQRKPDFDEGRISNRMLLALDLEVRLLRARASAAEAQPEDAAPITGVTNAAGDYRVHAVQIRLCEGCLLGLGQECHTGPCALCWHNSPGHLIDPAMYQVVERDTTL